MSSRGRESGREGRLSVDKFRCYTQRLNNPAKSDQQKDRHAGLYSPDCTVTYNNLLSNSPPPYDDVGSASDATHSSQLSAYRKENKREKRIKSTYKRDQDNRCRSPIFPIVENDEGGAIVQQELSDEESDGYQEAVFRPLDWQQPVRSRFSPERHRSVSPHHYGDSPVNQLDVEDGGHSWGKKWKLCDRFDKRESLERDNMHYRSGMSDKDKKDWNEMGNNSREPPWSQNVDRFKSLQLRRNFEQNDHRNFDNVKDLNLDRRREAVDRDLGRQDRYDRLDNHNMISDRIGYQTMKRRNNEEDLYVNLRKKSYNREWDEKPINQIRRPGMEQNVMCMENWESARDRECGRSGQHERKNSSDLRDLLDKRPGSNYSRRHEHRVRSECDTEIQSKKEINDDSLNFSRGLYFMKNINSEERDLDVTYSTSSNRLGREENSQGELPYHCRSDLEWGTAKINTANSFSPIQSQSSIERHISEVGSLSNNRREPPHSFSPILDPTVGSNKLGLEAHSGRRESPHSYSPIQCQTAVDRNPSQVGSHNRRREPSSSCFSVQPQTALERNRSGVGSHGNSRGETTRSYSPIFSQPAEERNRSGSSSYGYRRHTSRSPSPLLRSNIVVRNSRNKEKTSGVGSHGNRRRSPRSRSPIRFQRAERSRSGVNSYGRRKESHHSRSPILTRNAEKRKRSRLRSRDNTRRETSRSNSPLLPRTDGKRNSERTDPRGSRREPPLSHSSDLSQQDVERNISSIYSYKDRREPLCALSSNVPQLSTEMNSRISSGSGEPSWVSPLPPPPPPPPILSSSLTYLTDYSKPLPFKPSLAVDLESVKQSMELLERLKKKQEIVSKCEMKIRELYRKRIKLSNEPSAFFFRVKQSNFNCNTSPVGFCNNVLCFNFKGSYTPQLTCSNFQTSSLELAPTSSATLKKTTNLEMVSNLLPNLPLPSGRTSNVKNWCDEPSMLDKGCVSSLDPCSSEWQSQFKYPPSTLFHDGQSSNITYSVPQTSLNVPFTSASVCDTEWTQSTIVHENQQPSRGFGWPVSTSSAFKGNSSFKPTNSNILAPPPINSPETINPVIRPVRRPQPLRSQITLNLLPKANTTPATSKEEESTYVNKVEEFLARIQGGATTDRCSELSRDMVKDFTKSARNVNKPLFFDNNPKCNININENQNVTLGSDMNHPKSERMKLSTNALECPKLVVLSSSEDDEDVIYVGMEKNQQGFPDSSKSQNTAPVVKWKNLLESSCGNPLEKETTAPVDSANNVFTQECIKATPYLKRIQTHSAGMDCDKLFKKEMTNNATSQPLVNKIHSAKLETYISAKNCITGVPKVGLTNLCEIKTTVSYDGNNEKAKNVSSHFAQNMGPLQERNMSPILNSAICHSNLEKKRDFAELGDEPPGTSPTRPLSPLGMSYSKAKQLEEKPREFPLAEVPRKLPVTQTGNLTIVVGKSKISRPKLPTTFGSNLTVVVGRNKKPWQAQATFGQETPSQICNQTDTNQVIPIVGKQNNPPRQAPTTLRQQCNKTNLIFVESRVPNIVQSSPNMVNVTLPCGIIEPVESKQNISVKSSLDSNEKNIKKKRKRKKSKKRKPNFKNNLVSHSEAVDCKSDLSRAGLDKVGLYDFPTCSVPKENIFGEMREESYLGNSKCNISSNPIEPGETKQIGLLCDALVLDAVPNSIEEKQSSNQDIGTIERIPTVQTSPSDFENIYEEGNEIAKCIQDIQRNDNRLQKVYFNTLRNKAINKSLCIVNGMLCVEHEKSGARVVVSTVEEKIIYYLHCYFNHRNDNLPHILKKYFTPIKELGKKVKLAMKLCDQCTKKSNSVLPERNLCKDKVNSTMGSNFPVKDLDPLSEYLDDDFASDPMSIIRQIQTSSKHVKNILSRLGKEEKESYVLKNQLLLKRCTVEEKKTFKIFVPNDKIKEMILVAHTKLSEHGDLNCVSGILDRQFSPIDLVQNHVCTVISSCLHCSSVSK